MRLFSLLSVNFQQVPLPNIDQFNHNHECSMCNEWSRNGIITYSDEIESTKFICRKCQPVKLIPAQLPKKTEFREFHECIECQKKSKIGILTYCSRCEDGEFVCPICAQKWYSKITPDEVHDDFTFDDDLDDGFSFDDDSNNEIELEKKVVACIHVIDGYAKRYSIDKIFDNPKIAFCEECQDILDDIENSNVDITKIFMEIESSELRK